MPRPVHAFDRISGAYQQYRPTYPSGLLQRIVRELGGKRLRSTALTLVDVGCGTGIATRQLRRAAGPRARILGVDVNHDMLATARRATAKGDAIDYLPATAEALPFPDRSVDLVMVAQAIQWFDRLKFYREVVRVLRPGGLLAVLQNNRSWQSSSLLARYEDLLEARSPGYVRSYRDIDVEAEVRRTQGLGFRGRQAERWHRRMSRREFVGMALSSTKMQAAIRHCGRAAVLNELKRLLAAYGGRSGMLRAPYVSELFLAKKKLGQKRPDPNGDGLMIIDSTARARRLKALRRLRALPPLKQEWLRP